MNLHGIVAVSGKPGLWKALAQNKTGFVLESLDEHKTKLIANLATSKLAALDEITIFGDVGDIHLKDIFEQMKAAQGIPDLKQADGKTLRKFFFEVAPDHDEEKVYTSDIKKILAWFNIIKDLPLFTEEPEAIAEDHLTTVETKKKIGPVADDHKKPITKAVNKTNARMSQKSK
ncbi:MAG: DUF5606 domain-containing protein [Sphingobacteriaceae bacterium]